MFCGTFSSCSEITIVSEGFKGGTRGSPSHYAERRQSLGQQMLERSVVELRYEQNSVQAGKQN